jgi:hypothetical protein
LSKIINIDNYLGLDETLASLPIKWRDLLSYDYRFRSAQFGPHNQRERKDAIERWDKRNTGDIATKDHTTTTNCGEGGIRT